MLAAKSSLHQAAGKAATIKKWSRSKFGQVFSNGYSMKLQVLETYGFALPTAYEIRLDFGVHIGVQRCPYWWLKAVPFSDNRRQ